ncbi:MAG: diol dehydratase small subunit [Oscillospiraceae bacterium]|jgi:propanediol dehydratase small subunit|nr:diol dehydratase small subunit [Oscillospiraceae bacterium]MCI9363394.1 diol dehydratase small subunit [Oscillospiraceae bacterium]
MANNVEALVAALAKELQQAAPVMETLVKDLKPAPNPPQPAPAASGQYTQQDYPMLEKHRDAIRTPTGKTVDDITLESVLEGKVTMADVRISPEMLRAQADIAQDAGKPAMGENLRRAAELTQVPDEEVIRMYDMLRPNRATKAQLLELAKTLETQYHAPMCAALVREAVEVYEKRGILKAG